MHSPRQANSFTRSSEHARQAAPRKPVGHRRIGEAVAQHHGPRANAGAMTCAIQLRSAARRMSSSASVGQAARYAGSNTTCASHCSPTFVAAGHAQAQHLAAGCARSVSDKKRICVVLPAPSPPSNVMKMPRRASVACADSCITGMVVPSPFESVPWLDEVVHVAAPYVDADEDGEIDHVDAAQGLGFPDRRTPPSPMMPRTSPDRPRPRRMPRNKRNPSRGRHRALGRAAALAHRRRDACAVQRGGGEIHAAGRGGPDRAEGAPGRFGRGTRIEDGLTVQTVGQRAAGGFQLGQERTCPRRAACTKGR